MKISWEVAIGFIAIGALLYYLTKHVTSAVNNAPSAAVGAAAQLGAAAGDAVNNLISEVWNTTTMQGASTESDVESNLGISTPAAPGLPSGVAGLGDY